MHLTFKGQHLSVPEPIKEHARRRFARFDKFLSEATEVVLELRREDTKAAGERYVAQVTLQDSGCILRAEERARDMEMAVDAAVEKLDRQTRKFVGRRQKRDRTSLARTVVGEPVTVEAAEDEESEDFGAGRVVRIKRFAVKPMTVEEALDQVDLLGHTFFLFLNADENAYSVLYKRNDSGYGLIIPESR
jgi:putative sigma-54 modulation protein